jgi:hypothetical protein
MSATSNAATSNWQREAEPAPTPRPALRSGHWALGRALTVLLAGCAGVSGLKVLLDLYGVLLVSRWRADPSNFIASDGRHFDALTSVFALLGLLVLIPTGICTMTWLFQAYGSREADPALLPYRRWWTIGGWLIPFICLVRPFQLMGDLYRATAGAPPQEPPVPRAPAPSPLRWWWVCFVIGNVLSNLSARLMVGLTDFGSQQLSLGLDLVSQLFLIAAAVLFIAVLGLITTNLRRRASA